MFDMLVDPLAEALESGAWIGPSGRPDLAAGLAAGPASPPKALADFVRARDLYCRSPICGQHAGNCELDHNLAWGEDGVTADHNLWAGCPHDHHLKHAEGWTVTQHPDGRVEWITPTGHRYVSEPHDYRPEPS